MIKDETGKKLKSTISFEETLERFNKKKSKDLTVNDLQHEITIVKQEIIDLKNEFKNIKSDNHNIKQDLSLLKIDKNLDKQQSDNEQDEYKDGDESSQQTLLSDKGIVDNSQLSLVNKLLPPKWFTTVKIVVSHDYHFTMIDSGANMNCIQEGLIPSKYFEKSTERLVFANGSQMKIKYELNNAHVCHDNVCFKIPYVLVKNMTDKVILGLPFINALYHFLVEHDGITTDHFGQKVKFKFASKCEIDIDYASKIFIQEPMMGSCQYFTDTFKGNTHSTKLLTITNDPNILNISLQELHNVTWINTINKCDIDNISIYTTGKRILMASLIERRNKGKAPIQGSSHDKRLPAGRSFVRHEGASSGVKPSKSTSLQEFVPAEVTYSSGDIVIALQEVLS